MNRRMISPWKHPKSSLYWFRMAVPQRYRQRLGKSEVKQSLGTADIREARRLCALMQGSWLARLSKLDAEIAADVERVGIEAVDAFLVSEVSRYGGLDQVIAYELDSLALAESYCLDVAGIIESTDEPSIKSIFGGEAYPGFREADQSAAITLRRQALVKDQDGAVLTGAESACRALSLRFWEIATGFLDDAFAHAGIAVDTDDPKFAVAAEHYLKRLLAHPLPNLPALRAALPVPANIMPVSMPADAELRLEPSIERPASEARPQPVALDEPSRTRLFPLSADDRSISGVFERWAATQPANAAKLCDEWRVAIRRFTELFGNIDVGLIGKDMVMDFREVLRRLPTRPKRGIAKLPLLKQIEEADTADLQRLSGATVGKLVSGLRVALAFACDPLRIIRHNPADGVKVANAKSDIDARLPFDPDELRQIYASPAMTNPRDASSDSAFWLQLLAPLTGLRLEEMGKLRPSNVRIENGIWYIAVERDQARQRQAGISAGQQEKRAKTINSYRHVPLHWLLLEAGFADFAEGQAKRGREWLFDDLKADRYGNRTKYVSRQLVRHLRDIGITAEEKVFHSFRHSMKRACRNSMMKEEIADLLAGHAPASVGRKYGAGAALNVLQEAIDMIEYPDVAWDPVIAAARARIRAAD